jgi:hypothetical protein
VYKCACERESIYIYIFIYIFIIDKFTSHSMLYTLTEYTTKVQSFSVSFMSDTENRNLQERTAASKHYGTEISSSSVLPTSV